MVQGRRMKDNRHNFKEESFRVGIRKCFSPQGETGSGAGWSERLHSLCPWRFSRCDWTQLGATQPDLRDEPAVSRRMDARPFLPKMLCDHMITYCCLAWSSGLL